MRVPKSQAKWRTAESLRVHVLNPCSRQAVAIGNAAVEVELTGPVQALVA